MGRDAVKMQVTRDEGMFDFAGSLEFGAVLQHVVGRLGAGGAGGLRVIQKGGERFRAVLRAFDAGMKTGLSHKIKNDVRRFGHEAKTDQC